jgi:NAD+ synthase (glutamine-hydrolysing)
MKPVSFALVQLNVTVGALAANAQRIVARAKEAADAGADMIAFPELALSGYPPEDLVLRKHFLDDCEAQMERLARELPRDAVVIVGGPRRLDHGAANAAFVFHGGRMAAHYDKIALPNYGVFDEKRVFVAGDRALVLDIGGARVGIHICEDSWVLEDTACALLRGARLDALINLSASPYHRGKLNLREEALRKTVAFVDAHLLYCNLVGGQDELVFDGASMALSPAGRLLARAKQFEEDILYVQIPIRGGDGAPTSVSFPMIGKSPEKSSNVWKNRIAPTLDDVAEVYGALTLGLRDYVDKNGFKKVIVALSGGVDSALVATLAADALGRDRVAGVTMPSQYTSEETLGDAGLLAKDLGIQLFTVPIKRLYEAYAGELAPLWEGRKPDSTEENLQARIRANIVMALSNKFGWLVLTTGNKSELATGYCTLYGDMVGGFAVIKDVPKTLVFALARWRNGLASQPIIPPTTIARPPTAELRPNQKDTDTLPPYETLDPILERYIERDGGADEIAAAGFEPALVKSVIRMVDRNEYKRRQGAPGIKITPRAFGRDRRMPITNRYGEQT